MQSKLPDVYKYQTLSMPKLLHSMGLASSRSEAERLIKSGAVEINTEICKSMKITFIYDFDTSERLGYYFI